MCVSKFQHMTGRKTGCNRSRPFFFGFSIFRQTSQLATKKIQNLCNRNRWSGLLQLGSVWFRSFFQSSKLDLQTLALLDWAEQFTYDITGVFAIRGAAGWSWNPEEEGPIHTCSPTKPIGMATLIVAEGLEVWFYDSESCGTNGGSFLVDAIVCLEFNDRGMNEIWNKDNENIPGDE